MTAAARRLSMGAAVSDVPNAEADMALWIDGVPGSAVKVKVPAPSARAAQKRRLGMSASRNNCRPNG